MKTVQPEHAQTRQRKAIRRRAAHRAETADDDIEIHFLVRLAECSEREAIPSFVSASLVNVPPVADIVEINTSLLYIEFIEHAIIADSQLEFRTALEPLVRKTFQTYAHLITLR